MRHLKRFRTWLGYVYCAALALRQQRDQKNQYQIYDKAAERLPASDLTIDSTAVELEPRCRLDSMLRNCQACR